MSRHNRRKPGTASRIGDQLVREAQKVVDGLAPEKGNKQ